MSRYTPMELAQSFIRTGEFDDALEALDQQLTEQPTDDEARRWRAQILARRNRTQDAIADLHAIAKPTADDYVARSILEERLDNAGDAQLEWMHRAQQLAPHNERIAERLVYLYLRTQQLPKAREVVHQQPKTWRWQQYDADILTQMGHYSEAIEVYSGVIVHLDELLQSLVEKNVFYAIKARVLLARADCWMLISDYTQAQKDYIQAKRLVNDPTIDFNLGVIEAHRNNWQQAVTLCQKALQESSVALQKQMLENHHNDDLLQLLVQKLTT